MGNEPLLSHKKAIDWATQSGVLGYGAQHLCRGCWSTARKGAVLARTRKGVGRGVDGGAVGLLVEIFSLYQYDGGVLAEEAPLMAYWGVEVRRVWSREQTIRHLTSDITSVGKTWREGSGSKFRNQSRCIRDG